MEKENELNPEVAQPDGVETQQEEQDSTQAPEKKPEGLSDAVVLAALEASDKALEKAEKKIVELKRQAKRAGEEGDDSEQAELLERIAKLEGEIDSLKSGKVGEQDETQKELQAQRIANKELITALKAKNAMSIASDGANEDKPISKKESQGYSDADMALIQRHKLDPKKIPNTIK